MIHPELTAEQDEVVEAIAAFYYSDGDLSPKDAARGESACPEAFSEKPDGTRNRSGGAKEQTHEAVESSSRLIN